MNGPNATKRLRELGCEAYIIGITGNVLREDVILFKNKGANQVLPKPVRLASIQACWESLGPPSPTIMPAVEDDESPLA